MYTMKPRLDITGKKYGRLTAVKFAGRNNDNRDMWEFICDCGGTKTTAYRWVKSGTTKSCGCLASEVIAKRNFKHGATKHNNIKTREFSSWISMKSRLTNKSYHAYQHYIDRGITICDRWLDKDNGFNNFLADMGKRPLGKSLDRIDNDKGYYPENCRWATRKEQMNNTSANKQIIYNGVTMNQTQWAEKVGLPNSNIILKRLKRGWSIKRTLTTPSLVNWQVNDWRKGEQIND